MLINYVKWFHYSTASHEHRFIILFCPMVRGNKLIFLWAPIIGYCGLIFYLSSLPGNRLSHPPFPGADKVVHFSEYFILGFLLSRSCVLHTASSIFIDKRAILGGVVILTILFGISDEWHQSFVPHRSSDVMDLAADSIGGTTGTVVYYYLKMRKYHD